MDVRHVSLDCIEVDYISLLNDDSKEIESYASSRLIAGFKPIKLDMYEITIIHQYKIRPYIDVSVLNNNLIRVTPGRFTFSL